jgi:hypothetical protein
LQARPATVAAPRKAAAGVLAQAKSSVKCAPAAGRQTPLRSTARKLRLATCRTVACDGRQGFLAVDRE